MKRMLEVTRDEAAMADLGIPVDDLDFGVDDLPPDPLADQYEVMYDALYETTPVDGGSMRAAIDRVVAWHICVGAITRSNITAGGE